MCISFHRFISVNVRLGHLVLENCDYLLDHQFLFRDAQHLPYIYRSALWKTDPSKEKQTAFSSFICTISLTGLYNRMAYEKLALPLFQQYMQKGRPVGILFADADHSETYLNTDESRIGTFHEIGRRAATMQRQPDWIWN